MKVLVTGGAGFIGSNLIGYLLREAPELELTNLDKLTYAGNLENLAGVARPSTRRGGLGTSRGSGRRYRFTRGDVADRRAVERVFARGVDAVIHLAAETHVDRSLEDAAPFLRTNVVGTHELLEAAKRHGTGRFVHISTDEVYGSAEAGASFGESAPLRPSSPYAASKAAADLLVQSYARSHGLAAVILRCTNNYGPYQFPEKLIPLAIANALEDRPVPVYGDGMQARDWLYVEDHCRAILLALRRGRPGETYNISSGHSRPNLEVIRAVLRLLGKPETLLRFVEDRPGHDRRYALDSSKCREELGWAPQKEFEEGLARTVAWNRANAAWLEHCRSGAYRSYYRRHYTNRAKTLARWRQNRG
ncbi:MAG TPA: dTDP-glucose 4,6-dehydratase [Candidatus Acidoferrales bacterium]|nr:dTDP-glucose 4,6-dehydratase [Candidatus Acidoferrales bacterium]